MEQTIETLRKELDQKGNSLQQVAEEEARLQRQEEDQRSQLEFVLQQIEGELEAQRQSLEHQWKVMSYSETLMEDFENQREEEVRIDLISVLMELFRHGSS